MRLLLFLVATSLLVGSVACYWTGDIECASCDNTCQQTCEDSCSWLEYSRYYRCSEDMYGQVEWVDCDCYVSGWVWMFVVLICCSVLLVCCCAPPIIIVAYYWKTDPEKPIEAPPLGQYRLYSALNPCLYRYAVDCLNILSCRLCRPFLLLETIRMGLRRVDVRGTRLHMDAEWADYCKLVWLPTCIFNALTCGFYACCGFAEKREDEFLDERTSVEGQTGQPVVFFRAKANWWYRWIAALVTAWTCGLAYSFFYVDLVAKSVGLMNLAGVGATSMMDFGKFFSEVWLPGCVLDCITCHLYSCFAFARARQARYTDDHLSPTAVASTVATPIGNGDIYYGATTPGYSQPPSGPPPVPGQAYAGPNGAFVSPAKAPAMDDYSYL